MTSPPVFSPFTIRIFDQVIHIAITSLSRSYLVWIGDETASMRYFANGIQFYDTPVSSSIYNEGESTDAKLLAERVVRKLGKPVSIILGLDSVEPETLLALQQAIPDLVKNYIESASTPPPIEGLPLNDAAESPSPASEIQ